MKKQILALSIGLISLGMFAQKNELKAVDKALRKNDVKTAKQTIESIDENAVEDKYKAKYYFLKGSAYGKSNVKKAAEAYDKLFAVEKESGKAKYTKQAKPKLEALKKFVSEKAIQQYNVDKNYKQATKNFYLTYKLSPTDTIFLYNAAVSAGQAGEHDTSLEYFKKLQEIGYTGITTQYVATNKEGKEDIFPSKITRKIAVQTGSHTNPVDKKTESKQADIIKRIAYVYVNQGKPELAIAAIEEARKSNPKDLNLILNEADMYIKLKKMDKFEELMKEAVKLDPNNHILFFNLGIVNQRQNKSKEAIGFFKKAIELKPDYGEAYLSLSDAILAGEKAIVDEMNKNLNNFKKYEELEKKQKALYKEALPYLVKGDSIKRTFGSVRTLLNIYDILEMEKEADALRPIYKKMRDKQ